MRSDYDYVRGACDIVLCTTEAGDKLVEDWGGWEEPIKWGDKIPEQIKDLLVSVQAEYFKLTPDKTKTSTGTMEHWYELYKEEYACLYAPCPTTKEAFIKAFTDGYLSVQIVIWDEKTILG